MGQPSSLSSATSSTNDNLQLTTPSNSNNPPIQHEVQQNAPVTDGEHPRGHSRSASLFSRLSFSGLGNLGRGSFLATEDAPLIRHHDDSSINSHDSSEHSDSRIPKLIQLAKEGSFDKVRDFVENTNLDPMDENAIVEGVTAVHHAAAAGHRKIVQYLANLNRAVLNATDKKANETPLHWAARANQPKVVKFLLEQDDMDVGVRNRNGLTAQDVAKFANHADGKVYALLQDHASKNLLARIHEYSEEDIIPTLGGAPARADLTATANELDLPPLLRATCNGDEDEIRRLLAADARPDTIVDDFGRTALHWACAFGHAGIVTLLLDERANPNITTITR